MNERIKELVGQAKFMAEETINKQISKNAELDAFAEKFADLLIEECAMVAYRKGFCQECGGGEYISKDIRDHFRIKK
jgi:hypothetical protein